MFARKFVYKSLKLHFIYKDTDAKVKTFRQQGYMFNRIRRSTKIILLGLIKSIIIGNSVKGYIEQVVRVEELFSWGVAEFD